MLPISLAHYVTEDMVPKHAANWVDCFQAEEPRLQNEEGLGGAVQRQAAARPDDRALLPAKIHRSRRTHRPSSTF